MEVISSSQGEAVILVAPELASCVAKAPVPSVDFGQDGDAAVIDVVGAEIYVDVVESSTPVRATAGFGYEGFTFREAVRRSCRYFWSAPV